MILMSTLASDNDEQTSQFNAVTNALILEIFGLLVIKKATWLHPLLKPFFRPAVTRLVKIFLAFNQDTVQRGIVKASGEFLKWFVRDVEIVGNECIPKEGPLLVVSNHPAAYDVFILVANLGRDDVKVMTTEITLIRHLPAVYAHTIPIARDVHQRLVAMRAAIRHLQEGGALLIFPRGDVEPDPAISNTPLAYLDKWSSSIEVFLRKVPETKTVVSLAEGVLSPRWIRFPILYLWRKPQVRQKIAEMFQIIQQLVGSKDIYFTPSVRFSLPLTVTELGGLDAPHGVLRDAITQQAQALLVNRERKP